MGTWPMDGEILENPREIGWGKWMGTWNGLRF